MLDESRTIKAKLIVENPDDVHTLQRSHIILHDTSVSTTFSSMVDAINILHDRDWEIVSMSYDSTHMFVIMNNPNYKRKNSP